MVLLPAVWWIWMMTVWMTDRLDPERASTQLTVIGIMLGSLILASAVPEAFGRRGWFFAGTYVAVQLGRSLYLVVVLRETPNVGPSRLRATLKSTPTKVYTCR